MAVGMVRPRHFHGGKVDCVKKEVGGKTVHGIVGRKEKERSSSSKGIGSMRCYENNNRR